MTLARLAAPPANSAVSSTCGKPSVKLPEQSYNNYKVSAPGTLLSASATTFYFPLICIISNENWLKKSSQRALRLDTFALVCKYVKAI